MEDTPFAAAFPILVVDDDRANLELIEGRLSVEGLATVLVETGAEALAELEVRDFQAVLLDLRLPDADGLDILQVARARRPHLPVVIMTAHGSEATAVRALDAGASDYLVKPVTRRDLLFALRKAVERGDRASGRAARVPLRDLAGAGGIQVGTAAGDVAVRPWSEGAREGLVVATPASDDPALALLARALAVGLADVLGSTLELAAAPDAYRVTWPIPGPDRSTPGDPPA